MKEAPNDEKCGHIILYFVLRDFFLNSFCQRESHPAECSRLFGLKLEGQDRCYPERY